ncbi:ZIP family metal transporter [Candidatus Woesearchaeota archaeon]|jgi:zinc and cadmium transporter|nr:ZIP family metal transporter [Candidatus Woesearchaeota archaeon]MBT3537183.1 ZIP family metal transporter [Candidatus Woesearchaeota archaeon]MBT4696671.1 ZIP family metal transporter [Candidatus Woesearchaeota archaeon]MBT4716475.1 ZIP family metal transporter [Candidatus Woesearchaeota archaeon]MBT7106507.1 ZIP family metal transporter [Candidatus Woesearchaeota archaeon]
MNVMYALISVLVVSLVSIVFAIPFLLKKKISSKVLLFLLSFSVGVLLSTVFMNFLPEVMEHSHGIGASLFILSGFLVMFILEKFIHSHHQKKCEKNGCGHSHAYHLAPINLIGDAVHNFIDGLVIAGAYAVNVTLGVAATISIIFHEIPQEIADFGVLIYSGMSRKKALLFNVMSAVTAIIGTVIGILLIDKLHGFIDFIIPFAAGNFIYIAASNLVPQLHRHCKLKDTILHIFAIVLGVALVALITVYGPVHVH